MGPNNSCYVTRYFLFFSIGPFYKTFDVTFYSFYQRTQRISTAFKVAVSHFVFYPCGALPVTKGHLPGETMFLCLMIWLIKIDSTILTTSLCIHVYSNMVKHTVKCLSIKSLLCVHKYSTRQQTQHLTTNPAFIIADTCDI